MATRSLGRLTLDLVAKTGGFTAPIDRASRVSEREFKKMERDAKRAAQGFAAVTAAAVAAAGAIYAYGKSGMNAIDEQAKLARQLDSTIGGLRGLQLAANEAGVETGVINSAMERFSARLGEALRGTGQAAEALSRLGLSAAQLASTDVDERVALIADRVQALGLSGAETADVLRQFGIRNREIVNLLRQGGGAIRDARAEIDAFGLAISDVDAAAIEEANDSIARLGLAAEAAQSTVAIALTPALNDMADGLYEITKAFKAGEYDNQIRIMGHVATAAAGAAGGYAAYRTAVAAATIAQWAFNAAVRANPIGATVTVIGGAITVIGAAAGALYSMRKEAHKATIDVDGLTDSFRDLTDAQQENRRLEMAGDLAEMRIEAGKLGTELAKVSELVRNSGQLDEHGGAMPIASAEDIARGRELRAELDQVLTDIEAGSEVLEEYDAIMESVGRSTTITTDNTREQAKELAKLESEYSRLIDQLYPLEASQRQFREEMELLDLAAQADAIDNLADAQQRLRESYASGEDWQNAYGFMGDGDSDDGSYWERWLEGAENAFTDFDRMAADTAEAFSRSFGNAFESMVFDYESLGEAARGVAEDMARSVINALGQMAGQWLAYQAVQMMVGQSTQSAAASGAITNAMAKQQEASLNAYAATAAIPIYGPAAAPGAATTALAATTPMVAAISSLSSASLAGMAHDGIDSIPQTGTWLLEKGERVVTSDTSAKLDATLARIERDTHGGEVGGRASPITVHVDARGATDPRMVEEAARRGAKQGFDMVAHDLATNGKLRRMLGS